MRGNVIDLAVGVVIGTAFSKIIGSLVADIVMPPLSPMTSKFNVNFTDLAYRVRTEALKLNPDESPANGTPAHNSEPMSGS